jgi:hypothetical protein
MSTTYDPIDGEVILTTDAAVLIETPDGKERWVPRSCCEDGNDLDEGDDDIRIATWWLDREGWE